MIALYDSLSGIIYIQLESKGKIHHTTEFNPETVLELDQNDQLVGIEMIKPSRLILSRIAKKYQRAELGRLNLETLQKSIDYKPLF